MLTFPDLPGRAWSIHKRPIWNTRLAEHVSGRETRIGLWRWPRYEFEIDYNALASNDMHPGLQARSLQNFVSFFHACQGRLNPFVYVDDTDTRADGETIGTGDGTTASFTLCRTIGGFAEPVGWVLSVDAVYLNGVATDGWALTQPNTIRLSAPPAPGVIVTADFWFGFLCRLDDDQIDPEQFMSHLWSLKGVRFKTVRSV